MLGPFLLIALSLEAATMLVAPVENDKKVCRSVASEVGSRLGARRVCKLESEWRAEENDAQRALRALDDRGKDGQNLGGRGGEVPSLAPRPF